MCSQKLYKVVHGDLVVLDVQEEMRGARCEMLVSDKRYKRMTLVSWPSPASSRFPTAPSSSTTTNYFYLIRTAYGFVTSPDLSNGLPTFQT